MVMAANPSHASTTPLPAPTVRQRMRSIVPHGRTLTTEEWNRRHRAILIIIVLHIFGLFAFGLIRGYTVPHVAVDVGAVAVFALWATQPYGGRKVRASLASLSLLTASAMLVHLSGGKIEAHFHFFVVIALLMLYQDWLPYLVAIGYVVLQHGVIGTMFPTAVYDHAAAQTNPWFWAGVHGAFVLAASVANLTYWRVSENDHAKTLAALGQAARIDGLTGAVNRRGWEEVLPRALSAARRMGFKVCVALVDFDNFKDFNDSWGHQKGDLLLMRSVAAWKAELREEDTLARFGGDEFAIILPDCDIGAAQHVLERLLAVTPENQTCTVGLGVWNRRESASDFVSRIDGALYEGKRQKRPQPNSVHVATTSISRSAETNWSQRIPRLVSERLIRANYQPIVRLEDMRVFGYEALARPVDDSEGTEIEGMFEAASRLGHLRDLDWACRRAALEGGVDSSSEHPIFVNISLSALLDPIHGADQMVMLAEWSGRTADEIVLEITEREEARDMERLTEVVAEYRNHGFRFAVDDVGEGHSTLELLLATSPEFIKVARSLTAGTTSNNAVAAIQAIVTLASAQGGHVVAEGIESEEVLSTMRGLGVQLGQGYLLGRPTKPSLERLLGHSRLYAMRLAANQAA